MAICKYLLLYTHIFFGSVILLVHICPMLMLISVTSAICRLLNHVQPECSPRESSILGRVHIEIRLKSSFNRYAIVVIVIDEPGGNIIDD